MVKNLHSKKRHSGRIKKIVDELTQQMLDGKILNIEDAMIYHFDPRTYLSTMQSKGRMASCIQRACKAVEQSGKFAGSLGNGNFGIPKTIEETTKIITTKYYQLAGRSHSGKRCVEWAINNKLLPAGIDRKTISIYIPRQLSADSKLS
jgi:hypothetical protein